MGSGEDGSDHPAEDTSLSQQPDGDATDSTPHSSSGPDSSPHSSSGTEHAEDPDGSDPASLGDVIAAALDADADPESKTGASAPDADGTDAQSAETGDKSGEDAAESNGTVEDGSEDGEADTGSQDADDDLTDEDVAALKPGTRKRVERLLSQRNEAREEAAALEGDAGNYRNIRRFMSDNQLGDEDVANLFRAGADLKSGDPERLGRFLERVMPLVRHAMEATGQVLSADLQEQVDAGEMTEDAARTMARTRGQASFAQDRARAAETAQTEAASAARAESLATQIVSATDTWYQQTRQTDPDFDLKAEAIRRVAQAMVAEKGLPRTPAEAVEYAKAAHAEATRWMKAAQPAPRATRPAPDSQTAAKPGLAAEAASLEAIVDQAFSS